MRHWQCNAVLDDQVKIQSGMASRKVVDYICILNVSGPLSLCVILYGEINSK